jgi:hypothetical protein
MRHHVRYVRLRFAGGLKYNGCYPLGRLGVKLVELENDKTKIEIICNSSLANRERTLL